MSARLSHLLPVAVAALLVALTLWLQHLTAPPVSPETARRAGDPDAVVDRLTLRQLSEDGTVAFEITAKQMIHYGGNNATELIEPRLRQIEPGMSTRISAARGVVEHDYREARFYDNVELVRTARGAGEGLRVSTQYLRVLPRDDLVDSDRRVVITRDGAVLSGTGMQYHRKSGQLSLLSEVRGSFHARRR